jgi:hypothetical protein
MCFIMPSFCTDAMYFDTIHSFSFPLPPSPSPIEQSHYCKHVLYINVYMTMFVFVNTFIFWIYLSHVRENIITPIFNLQKSAPVLKCKVFLSLIYPFPLNLVPAGD